MTRTIESSNLEATHQIGRELGRRLGCGQVLALIGPLGSGKTTLVRGIADGAGVVDLRQVNSPTFVIVNEYQATQRDGGQCGPQDGRSNSSAAMLSPSCERLRIYHIDAYRLRGPADLEALGFDEMCTAGAVIVEWADRVLELLPPEYLRVDLENTGESSRRLVLTAVGAACQRLLEVDI